MAEEQQAPEQESQVDGLSATAEGGIRLIDEAQQTPEDATGQTDGGEGKRFTQDDLDRIVKERLDRAKAQADKAAAQAAEEAQRKAAEEQGQYKELYEKMQAQLQDAESKAAELERAALRREAADKAGLPAALADRLRGDTVEDMIGDAKEILSAMPKQNAPANINGPARGTSKQAPDDDAIREQAAVLGVSFDLLKQQYGGD